MAVEANVAASTQNQARSPPAQRGERHFRRSFDRRTIRVAAVDRKNWPKTGQCSDRLPRFHPADSRSGVSRKLPRMVPGTRPVAWFQPGTRVVAGNRAQAMILSSAFARRAQYRPVREYLLRSRERIHLRKHPQALKATACRASTSRACPGILARGPAWTRSTANPHRT